MINLEIDKLINFYSPHDMYDGFVYVSDDEGNSDDTIILN